MFLTGCLTRVQDVSLDWERRGGIHPPMPQRIAERAQRSHKDRAPHNFIALAS